MQPFLIRSSPLYPAKRGVRLAFAALLAAVLSVCTPGALGAAEADAAVAVAGLPTLLLALLVALLLGVLIGIALGRRGRALQAPLAARERSSLERALARRNEMLNAVTEVLVRTDADGRIRFVNKVWETLSGDAVAHSRGKLLADYLHPDDRERGQQLLREVANGVRPACTTELRLRTAGGEVRWVELSCRATDAAGSGDGGITGTLNDISARKVAELTLRNLNQELETRVQLRTAALEASNRELEAFSYSVSHDLRAPLRAIDGFARILGEDFDDRLDDSGRSHLQRIRNAAERMALLIDALINLASLARKPLHKESVDLSALAASIIDELRAEEPQRAVDVEITQDLIVRADRALMNAVLNNLLRNAWKFTSRQHRARIVFCAERADEQRVFCVRDNGAGFDMTYADKLFRPFHRLHGNEDFPGTGIGLATVQRIVERHDGAIWAESTPGEGAEFRFTLGP